LNIGGGYVRHAEKKENDDCAREFHRNDCAFCVRPEQASAEQAQ
jgi:hypothetical protein